MSKEMITIYRYIMNGYHVLHLPGHHLADKQGNVYEHRLIAEKILNRNLNPNEVVHHIDLNRKNNSVENLMIFKTEADHTRFHKQNLNLAYAHKEKDVWVVEPITLICPICGGYKSYKSKKCATCYRNERLKRSNRPPKDVLETLIYELPFTKIGQKYHVTDKAVKKWCQYYNLPCKSSEIKQLKAI